MTKEIINFIFIFLLVWWTVLFCALPFGVEKDDNKDFPGNSSGAPKNARMKIKFLVTTIVSLIVTGLIFYFLDV